MLCDTMVEAVEMAEDALNLMLWDKEETKNRFRILLCRRISV
ncbi:MAG: hypothetical protein ACLUIQ_11985 [Dialister invisus]